MSPHPHTSDVRAIMVGLGEILWDLLPDGRTLGGAPANFAYHAHCLGANAHVVSSVGKDALGAAIHAALKELCVNRNYLSTDADHPTGTVEVTLDASGVPSYTIHEGVAWDFLTASPPVLALAACADAVCFGSLAQRHAVSRQAVRAFLRHTRDTCLRIFDVNLRQHDYTEDTLCESLELANCLKLNEEELPVLLGMCDIDSTDVTALQQLAKRFDLVAAALTLGNRGSVMIRGAEVSVHDGCRTPVADTVGAGDAFTAAFAVGLRQGLPLADVNTAANRLAAFVCGHAGATPMMPRSFIAGLKLRPDRSDAV